MCYSRVSFVRLPPLFVGLALAPCVFCVALCVSTPVTVSRWAAFAAAECAQRRGILFEIYVNIVCLARVLITSNTKRWEWREGERDTVPSTPSLPEAAPPAPHCDMLANNNAPLLLLRLLITTTKQQIRSVFCYFQYQTTK